MTARLAAPPSGNQDESHDEAGRPAIVSRAYFA